MKSVLNKSNLSSSPIDDESEHKAESEGKPIHEKVIMEENENEKNKDSGSKLLSQSAKSNEKIVPEEKKEKEKSIGSKSPSKNILSGDKLKSNERMKSAKNLLADEQKHIDLVSKK